MQERSVLLASVPLHYISIAISRTYVSTWYHPTSGRLLIEFRYGLSGQMQFTIADLTLAFDRIELYACNSFIKKKQIRLPRSKPAHNSASGWISYGLLYLDGLTLSRKLFLITFVSFIRALASCAFTVPAGTPRRCAVSRMLRPSMSRS